MMSGGMALKIAIDLLHVPSRIRLYRSEPLPDDVLTLLRIVAGDTEVERAAATLVDRPPQVVRQAAGFFIEQILFAPDADSYQVLGASPQASSDELRRNVGFLLKWLHPDLDSRSERSIFIGRVTAAWNDLKTPERRAAYDQTRRNVPDRRKSQHRMQRVRSWRHKNRIPMASMAPNRESDLVDARSTGFLRRALSILFQLRP
jgi:DnaJ-domain-containing protein 1